MSKGKGMINNPIYRGSSIYEEIPESPEAVYQNSGVQNAAKAHPPSLPGPRKGEPSNTESQAMKQNNPSLSLVFVLCMDGSKAMPCSALFVIKESFCL